MPLETGKCLPKVSMRLYCRDSNPQMETDSQALEMSLIGRHSCYVTDAPTASLMPLPLLSAEPDADDYAFGGEEEVDDTVWYCGLPFPKGRAAWDRMAIAILLLAIFCLISACDKTP